MFAEKLCHAQDVNVRKNQQMLSSFFFSACEVLNPGQQTHTPFASHSSSVPYGQPGGSTSRHKTAMAVHCHVHAESYTSTTLCV